MNSRKVNMILDMTMPTQSQKARILIHRLSTHGMVVRVDGEGYRELPYKTIHRKERTWPSSWAE